MEYIIYNPHPHNSNKVSPVHCIIYEICWLTDRQNVLFAIKNANMMINNEMISIKIETIADM